MKDLRKCPGCGASVFKSLSHKLPDGEYHFLCLICAKKWNNNLGPGSGYHYRNLKWTKTESLENIEDGKPLWHYTNWGFLPFRRAAAIEAIKKWCESNSDWEYATTQCSCCGNYHNQADWKGDECTDCQEKNMPKPSIVRNVGDIWSIPKENSPMWTQQWGYADSPTRIYIVSRYSHTLTMGTGRTSDGWDCNCPSFPQNTPRVSCKHILNVQKKAGIAGVKNSSVVLANVDDKKMAAFEAWQREQAARKKDNNPTAGAKLALFGTTTRKFR